MAFWSGEKLARHLPGLITDFTEKNLDCASYRLSVGDQVFATSDKFTSNSPSDALVSVLKDPPENLLRIRPGQFAFLMTRENVRVPDDALALISIRAGYKFKGLINVSGFHVDPGWHGKLLFSVYNAGPAEVIVERGEPMFLIVYADLDRVSTKIYDGASMGQVGIKASLLTNMTEQVFSPLMLQRHMTELERRTDEISAELERRTNEVNVKVDIAASQVSIAFKTLFTFVSMLMATYAVMSTLAPNWFGVTLAKTLEAAGYEIKQKQSEASSDDVAQAKRNAEELKNASSASATVDVSAETAALEHLAPKFVEPGAGKSNSPPLNSDHGMQ